MKIKQSMEKIPGGMVIIPLVIAVLMNSFMPDIFEIGGFTTALLKTGSPTLIGMFLLCMGAGINIKSAPKSFLQGTAITFTKLIIAVFIGFAVNHFFGINGIWGLTVLTIIAAMSNSNGGLYAALVGEFGTEQDLGAISILSLNDGPFLTMLALGIAGVVTIPLMALTSVLLPIIIGMILGNLDTDMRAFLTKGGPLLIPFLAFSLGANIDLSILVNAGFAGVLLGVFTTFVGGFFNIIADRLVGGSGIAGASASSTAGNAVATPAAIVAADPSLDATVMIVAVPLIATSVMTTALLTPIFVAWIAKRNACGKGFLFFKLNGARK